MLMVERPDDIEGKKVMISVSYIPLSDLVDIFQPKQMLTRPNYFLYYAWARIKSISFFPSLYR